MPESRDTFLKRMYTTIGRLPENWKTKADQTIDERVIDAIGEQLYAFDVMPSLDQDVVFLSPSANTGTHEEQLFHKDIQRRNGKSVFIVGDISSLEIPDDRKQKNIQEGKGRFLYVQMNGNELPIRDEAINVLWDRKGNLWHIAAENTEKSYDDLIAAIEHYRKKLTRDGSIVIDAIPQEISAESSTIEESTISKFNKLKRSKELWEYIHTHFEVMELGRGLSSIVVFKKKKKDKLES